MSDMFVAFSNVSIACCMRLLAVEIVLSWTHGDAHWSYNTYFATELCRRELLERPDARYSAVLVVHRMGVRRVLDTSPNRSINSQCRFSSKGFTVTESRSNLRQISYGGCCDRWEWLGGG